MQTVIITEDQLKAAQACSAYLKSPEWDEQQRALIYTDFDKTVERLSGTAHGRRHLQFLVAKKLVPLAVAPSSFGKTESA